MMAMCGFMAGWGARMLCVNHPDSPGQPREVWPGETCRNFHAKHKPPVRLPPEPPSKDVRYIGLTRGLSAIVDADGDERLNRRPSGLTGLKGVTFHRGKWDAQIGHNGKQMTIGSFDTKEEAARARDEKAIELWAEYAWLNDVDPTHPAARTSPAHRLP